MGFLFALAIIVAIGAVVAKKVRTGRRFVEDTAPRIVNSYREIDDGLPRKCACGGRFDKQGEGPKRLDGAECVRVVVVCDRCERVRALVFRVAS